MNTVSFETWGNAFAHLTKNEQHELCELASILGELCYDMDNIEAWYEPLYNRWNKLGTIAMCRYEESIST
jgi:hypothetical protein